MKTITAAILGTLFGSWVVANEPLSATDFSRFSVVELEQQIASMNREVQSLARLSLRNEVGAIGHRSVAHDSANATEWVQVDLGDVVSIDEIVLVPTLWRDTDKGFRADGFPVEFQIVAGTSADEPESVIASFTANDHIQPRVAPVIVRCESVMASWVRVEATQLSTRGFDSKFILHLSEILVFNGQENVALHRPVRTSSKSWIAGGAREDRFVVDGDVPYLMDSSDGQQSLAFIGVGSLDAPAILTIDLLQSQPINRIQLHVIDTSDTAPRSTPTDYGVPRHLVLEGANREDFSDWATLCEFRVRSVFDVSPIMTRRFDAKMCRYVRLKAIEPYVLMREDKETTRLGFAEIEIFSDGSNVAFEKPVVATNVKLVRDRPLAALTDGRNLYGKVLPIRDWLEELSRRHDLEATRPMVSAELNARYASQKNMLRLMQWLAVGLVGGIALTFLMSNRIRKQKIANLRRRFAADLHDELGANLHTIGLLSDLAQRSQTSSKELTRLHTRIRAMTTRSAAAIRYWVDVEQSEEFCTDLNADMQRAAQRIVAHLKHDFQIDDDEHLARLNSQTRVDLLLFYKECLINICRHSEATYLRTDMNVSAEKICLTIVDNGCGVSQAEGENIPSSLQRRAKLLGAKINIDRPTDGGTGIRLTLPIRKRRHC